jgi:hypothetical protein
MGPNAGRIPPYLTLISAHSALITGTGVTIDIWALPKGQCIENAISQFPHDIDSLAWRVGGNSLIASDGALQSVANRNLSINLAAIDSMSERDVSYTAIKSVSLIIRHNLEFDSSVTQLLKRNFESSSPIKKHAISLVKELHICGVNDIFDVTEYIRKISGTNAATSLLITEGHCVYGHLVGAPFLCERSRQTDNTRFGGRIIGLSRGASCSG